VLRITYVPHALEQMERRGISEEEVAAVLEDPNEEGPANFGRLYAQSVIGHRRIRVVYNRGRMRPWWSRSCSAEGKVVDREDQPRQGIRGSVCRAS
jgi:hypothetical protein